MSDAERIAELEDLLDKERSYTAVFEIQVEQRVAEMVNDHIGELRASLLEMQDFAFRLKPRFDMNKWHGSDNWEIDSTLARINHEVRNIQADLIAAKCNIQICINNMEKSCTD